MPAANGRVVNCLRQGYYRLTMALTIEGPAPRQPQQAGTTDLVLRGASADNYVDALRHGIAAARLNAHYPAGRLLLAHMGYLGGQGSEGLYADLRLSRKNGLPSAFDVLRVNVDHGLAQRFSGQLGRGRQEVSHGPRLERRIRYYQRLLRQGLMPLNRMQVDLRQQLPDQRLALFRVVLDRFDLRRNQFVRYTLLLGQRDRFWRRRKLKIDDADLVAATEEFRGLVGLLSFHAAPQAYEMLDAHQQLEVEDVRRCRVGPMILPGMESSRPLASLLEASAASGDGGLTPFVLCCPEDRASDQLARDAGRDLPALLLNRDVGQARASSEAQRSYRVVHSCKLVCRPAAQRPLQRLCQQLGAPSIVRPV